MSANLPIGNWQDRSREHKSNRFATMKMFSFYDLALPFQGSTYTNSLKPPPALLSSEFYSSSFFLHIPPERYIPRWDNEVLSWACLGSLLLYHFYGKAYSYSWSICLPEHIVALLVLFRTKSVSKSTLSETSCFVCLRKCLRMPFSKGLRLFETL